MRALVFVVVVSGCGSVKGNSTDGGSDSSGPDGPPPKAPTFIQPAKRLDTPYGATIGVAVCDFSADGLPDIVTFDPGNNSGVVSVLVSDGHGNFATALNTNPGSTSTAAAISCGLMGNQTEGVALANAASDMSLFTSDATGPMYFTNYNFAFNQPPPKPTKGQASAMAVLDASTTKSYILEGTDEELIVAAPAAGNNYTTPGATYLPQTSITGIAVAKLVGSTETTPDVVAVGTDSTGSNVYVLLNNGSAALGLPSKLALPAAPTAVTTGDVNGGGIDIVAASADHVFVFLNKGDGTFGASPAHSFATQATVTAVALADFNGDGKLDIATASHGTDQVAILTGNGDGTFNTPVVFAAGQGVSGIGVADFNGDGKPDIVVGGDFNLALLINSTN
jgi:VCBS repeat protein